MIVRILGAVAAVCGLVACSSSKDSHTNALDASPLTTGGAMGAGGACVNGQCVSTGAGGACVNGQCVSTGAGGACVNGQCVSTSLKGGGACLAEGAKCVGTTVDCCDGLLCSDYEQQCLLQCSGGSSDGVCVLAFNAGRPGSKGYCCQTTGSKGGKGPVGFVCGARCDTTGTGTAGPP